MIKPFSVDLYNKNDNAKELIIKLLQDKGLKAWINPDKYGIDVIAQRDNNPYIYYEVEVKHNWTGAVFPFQTIHIPARKLKFANYRCRFVILNAERTHMIVVPASKLLESAIITKSTIYTQGEQFVEVSINE